MEAQEGEVDHFPVFTVRTVVVFTGDGADALNSMDKAWGSRMRLSISVQNEQRWCAKPGESSRIEGWVHLRQCFGDSVRLVYVRAERLVCVRCDHGDEPVAHRLPL